MTTITTWEEYRETVKDGYCESYEDDSEDEGDEDFIQLTVTLAFTAEDVFGLINENDPPNPRR